MTTDLSQRARQVRLALFDVDGVMTDGTVFVSGQGESFKPFSILDGLGLKMLDYDEDHRKRFLGQPLDHIYVRGLEVLEATTRQVDSSDHNPMSVRLRL